MDGQQRSSRYHILLDKACSSLSSSNISFLLLATIFADVPEDRTNFPPSPGRNSKLWTNVPSGISRNNNIFPVFTSVVPQATSLPTQMPSGAKDNDFIPLS